MNIDPAEIAKFSESAAHWWDLNGEFKMLHELNPFRLHFITQKSPIAGKKIIDIGCGGGILSESMAQLNAQVTAIDMSQAALNVAKLHAIETNTTVEYIHTTAEQLASERPGEYDIVTCMEMLEHVPDPLSIIRACSTLVKPKGHVFFSTLNRNLKSYLFGIVAAEYILKLLPQQTHDYSKFIRPSELADWARAAELTIKELKGIHYNPLSKKFSMNNDISVNYLAWAEKQ